MELRGDPPFKVRAFREAARQLDLVTEDVSALSREGRLTNVKGVGASIARTIAEYLERGDSQPLAQLREVVPESLVELVGLRHFGPQRIVRVRRALGLTSLDDLEAAARDGRLATVQGFGQRTVETLLKSIEQFRVLRLRAPRYLAEAVAQTLVHSLRQLAAVARVDLVGSVRRLAETVAN